MYSTASFRQRAWNALKSIFPVALVVSLCATLPTLLGQVAVTRNSGPLLDAVMYIRSHEDMNAVQMMDLLEQSFTPALGIALAGQFLLTIVFSFLRIGRYSYLLKVLRGEESAISDVLSRTGILLKTMGQQLYVMWLTFLWGLPGGVMTIVGAVVFIMAPSAETLMLMESMYLGGLLVSVVLGIRASLHYAMAPIILADKPETGIRASIKASVGIMRRRKLLYVSLLISFIGWILLESMAESLLTTISTLVGLTLGMALQLALNLYVDTATVAFYDAYRPNGVPPTSQIEHIEELNP